MAHIAKVNLHLGKEIGAIKKGETLNVPPKVLEALIKEGHAEEKPAAQAAPKPQGPNK